MPPPLDPAPFLYDGYADEELDALAMHAQNNLHLDPNGRPFLEVTANYLFLIYTTRWLSDVGFDGIGWIIVYSIVA